MADKYDDLYQIACCIRQQTLQLLEADPILHAPTRGGISHAGESFCCDALWVLLDNPTIPDRDFPGADKCSTPITENFRVLLGLNACSERNFFEGDCGGDSADCVANDEGCFEPSHQIGTTDCSGPTPTVLDESAYVWRARSLLRRELACKVQCCVDGTGCVGIRCRSAAITSLVQRTEGACAYIELTLSVGL